MTKAEQRLFWCVEYDIPAHQSFVYPVQEDEMWISGRGDFDLFDTEEEAFAAAAEFDKCPAAERGEYCYSHNPTGR